MGPNDRVLMRDLAIFQVKLLLDGLKDIVLAPLAVVVALVDMLFPGAERGHRFYALMRLGERFDRWLNLFSGAERAERSSDGLFGDQRTTADSMLGRIESMLVDESAEARRRSAGPAA